MQLKNNGATVALENKLTLMNNKDGSRILPAYYRDNYVSLLPGETREIDINYPETAAGRNKPELTLGGWSLPPRQLQLRQGTRARGK